MRKLFFNLGKHLFVCYNFWKHGTTSFLMHSFLVSPQIASCCGMINAVSLSRFDVTMKTLFFRMCCLNVVCQFYFATECFVTDIAGGLHFCVDGPVVVKQCVFSNELLPTCNADKIANHFDEICGVLLLLGQPADTDWPFYHFQILF